LDSGSPSENRDSALAAPKGRCPGVEMKRIRGDSDFLSIPGKEGGSEAPLRWLDPVGQVMTLWIR